MSPLRSAERNGLDSELFILDIFVLGSPRSGTTVVGNFIASHPTGFNLGEYYGFVLAAAQAPQIVKHVPSRVKEAYLDDLVANARRFADNARDAAGSLFWCDQTPFNIQVVQTIERHVPDALYVLLLRDYRSTVLSLRQSYASGRMWAGAQISDSALLWASSYKQVDELPADRTLVVSYNELCKAPERAVERIEREVATRLNIDPHGFDRAVLTQSHASSKGVARPTIAKRSDAGIEFMPIAPYDASRWTDGMEAACAPYVRETDSLLRARFGDLYESPIEIAGGV